MKRLSAAASRLLGRAAARARAAATAVRPHAHRLAGAARAGSQRVAPRARHAKARLAAGLSTPRRRAAVVIAAAVAILAVAVVTTRDEEAARRGGPVAATGAPGLPPAAAGALERLSVRGKVAQLMLVGPADGEAPVPPALERLGYGGLVIAEGDYDSSAELDEALADARRPRGRARIAPWILAKQDGGEFNALADLPPDRAPAELANPRQAAGDAAEAARALSKVGVNGLYGPTVDVGPESGGALGTRLYSDSPRRVRAYGLAVLGAFEDAGLFTAPKHFPGLGGASQSPELGPANVGLTLEQLGERDLIPFVGMIDAGAPGIVVGHGLYGVDDFVTPASVSRTILVDLLREQLGFEGAAIADDVTAPAITVAFSPARAAVDAVRSGADLVYVSRDAAEQRAVLDALLEAVRSGRIEPDRLDEAVGRSLAAKDEAGLIAGPRGRSGSAARGRSRR